jgi:hypothetical protein
LHLLQERLLEPVQILLEQCQTEHHLRHVLRLLEQELLHD